MKITNLEKNTNLIDDTVKINVEITIDKKDIEYFYFGTMFGTPLDPVPDEVIPTIIEEMGKMYKGKIKNGKITI